MGTKPVPAVLLTAVLQLVGIAIWSWATGRAVRLFGGSPQITAPWLTVVLVGVIGAAIVGLAGIATKLSAMGLVVVGAVHVVAAAVMMLLPVRVSGSSNPMFNLSISLRRVSPELSDGMIMLTAAGTGLVLGAVMIGMGIALRPAGASGAGLSSGVGRPIALGVVAALLAVGACLAGGWTYVQMFMYLRSSAGVALIALLCAAGVAVCFALMRNARVGGLVVAVLLLLFGLLMTSPSIVLSLGLPSRIVGPLLQTSSGGGFVMSAVAVALLGLTSRGAAPAQQWYGAAPSAGQGPTTGQGPTELR